MNRPGFPGDCFAGLSREAGIDPKLVADQLAHGLGVNPDVYTVVALEERQHAVEILEASLVQRSYSAPGTSG